MRSARDDPVNERLWPALTSKAGSTEHPHVWDKPRASDSAGLNPRRSRLRQCEGTGTSTVSGVGVAKSRPSNAQATWQGRPSHRTSFGARLGRCPDRRTSGNPRPRVGRPRAIAPEPGCPHRGQHGPRQTASRTSPCHFVCQQQGAATPTPPQAQPCPPHDPKLTACHEGSPR